MRYICLGVTGKGTPISDYSSRARQYRERAEELRTIAQDWIGQDTQNALAKVARDYDHMAETLERVSSPTANALPI